MEEVYIDDLLLEYDQAIADKKTLSNTWLKNLLKDLRKSKLTRPDIVLKYGPQLISYETNVEAWNLREQIAIANLEYGQFEEAEKYIVILDKQFPNSHRVQKLQGMLCEARGQFDKALEIYDNILRRDAVNLGAMKRKAAIKKGQHDLAGEITELNNIINLYPSDIDAWLALAEIYLSQCEYDTAAYCYEELILVEPKNAHFHCRLAETLFTKGEVLDILLARKQYTISLTCQSAKFNVRSLYGLIACCTALNETFATMNLNSWANMIQQSQCKENFSFEQEKLVTNELLRWSKDQFEQLKLENSSTLSLNALNTLEKILF